MNAFPNWTMADLLHLRGVHDRWREKPLASVSGFYAYAEAVKAEILRRNAE